MEGSAESPLAGNILFSAEDAEECVSDTYLKAWRTMPPARPRHLFAYLAKICRFTAFDALDWKKRAEAKGAGGGAVRTSWPSAFRDAAADRQIEGQAIGRALEQFIKGLPPRQAKRYFLRRYWFEQPVAEIAAAEGCSEGLVKTRSTVCGGAARSFGRGGVFI